METILGDYVGATIGIHSPFPYECLTAKELPSPISCGCIQRSGLRICVKTSEDSGVSICRGIRGCHF